MITRREFLGVACLVLGCPGSLLADDQTPFEEALALMKKLKKHGLALILPEGEKERAAFGRQLEARIELQAFANQPAPSVALLLLEVVWVCVPAKKVEAKEGENCVLLDEEGKRVAGAKIDFSDQKKFEKGLKDLLEGEGRLEKRAEKATTDEVKKALETKDADYFYKHQDELVPVMVSAIRSSDTDARFKSQLERLLGRSYWSRLQGAKDLPFGVKWEVSTETDSCPPCGKAGAKLEGRKFLEFLTK